MVSMGIRKLWKNLSGKALEEAYRTALQHRDEHVKLLEQQIDARDAQIERLLSVHFVVKTRTKDETGAYGDFVECLNVNTDTAYTLAKLAQDEDLELFNALNFGDTQLKYGAVINV